MTEELLLEDFNIKPLTFSEFRMLNEVYHNFLPSDVGKKKTHAKEVFDMVHKSYESQGGIKGKGFESPEEMVKHLPMWKLAKKNGKVISAALYKDTNGRKRVCAASDGSSDGKKAAGDMIASDLKLKRAHMEVSGKSLLFLKKIADIKPHLHSYEAAEKFHKSRGDTISRPHDDDKEVLRHPELKDHMYSRMLGGELHTKVMLGHQGNHIIEAKVYDKNHEQINGKDSPLGQETFKKGDWTFNPKGHAPSQAKEHRPDWKPEYWHTLHDKVHSVLTNHENQHVEHGQFKQKVKTGEALFYSRKQKQGYFANVDHDKKEIRLITVLPPGQSKVTKHTDQRILLDSVEILQIIYLD